ncbi:MAG TPA: DUF3857 domain-containing protein [Terracidiphilus sp.]|nr:DUF3857 domain-containing protein [Terracidiphilus sp.]
MNRMVGYVLAAFVFLGPCAALAQFREPKKAELQMTSDPMAPGADAVYLYREEKTDDMLHFHSIYARIKVLTEKGKQLATVRIPYERRSFQVRDIEGRTIHPDGTVIKMTTKPSDLMAFKSGTTQVNTMVFTLPSVEVGSILEYQLDIQYDDNMVSSPTWDVQQPYFVHEAHYLFVPSRTPGTISNSRGQALTRLMYGQRGGNGAKVQEDIRGRYSYDVTNVPALPDDDWMPPLNSLRWKVDFYYTAYTSGQEFWKDEGKYWAKKTEEFANPSKELRKAVSGMVAPGDSEDQKARKIYAAVEALENTDFTRAKSEEELKQAKLKEAKNAEDVWTRKSGTSDQLALLYVALARAAGLTAYPMEVVDRNRALFDASYLSIDQLDDYIAIVVVDGKEVFLDPGQKMCPYGLLHWKHALAGGLRVTAKGTELALSAADTYKQDMLERVANLYRQPNGQLSGIVRYVMSGQEALRWRQALLLNNPDEVKKQFNEWIHGDLPDGVQGDFDHFLATADYDENLVATVKVTGSIGSATGKRVFLPSEFFESRGKLPFVAEAKRTVPVDVHYARMVEDSVTYTLPAGFQEEGALPPVSLSWPDHAVMRVVSKSSGAQVSVTRLLMYNYALLNSQDYGNLHDFYQKVAKADSQQLVLDRSNSAAGN